MIQIVSSEDALKEYTITADRGARGGLKLLPVGVYSAIESKSFLVLNLFRILLSSSRIEQEA